MNTQTYLGFIQATFIIMNLIIAIGVYRDCRRVESTLGKELKIFDPVGWCALSFLGGLFTLTIYAALHHTRLVKK
jgi:hypothetical protein